MKLVNAFVHLHLWNWCFGPCQLQAVSSFQTSRNLFCMFVFGGAQRCRSESLIQDLDRKRVLSLQWVLPDTADLLVFACVCVRETAAFSDTLWTQTSNESSFQDLLSNIFKTLSHLSSLVWKWAQGVKVFESSRSKCVKMFPFDTILECWTTTAWGHFY